MYNKDVLNALIVEFGIENAIIYCKMESRKSQLMLEDSIRRGEIGSSEWEFERDWWANEQQELSNLKQNRNEYVRTFRKKSENHNSDKTVVFKKNVKRSLRS